MELNLFDYEYDENLIARYPLRERESSRLLAVDVKNFRIEHKRFYQITDYIDKGDVLVVNNSRVKKARLKGKRVSGGKVEIFVSEFPKNLFFPLALKVLLNSHKTVKAGEKIYLNDNTPVEVLKNLGNGVYEILIKDSKEFDFIFNHCAMMPLPPYLKREPEEIDEVYYQTVYSDDSCGFSVAAPTAGLHFSDRLIKSAEKKGAIFTGISLNIGLGTFTPVREGIIENHEMHPETFSIPEKSANIINGASRSGKKIILTGTSSVRCLETAANDMGAVSEIREKKTSLYIYPGYKFKITKNLITNFHQPKSSLFIMISALVGLERAKALYSEAIKNGYSLFSFGDAMYLYNID